MMTYAEARKFQANLTEETRQLTRTRKKDLEARRAQILAADGIICVSGGPATKDELVSDILDRRYPIAQVNEASHVLYHAPSARWSACDYCAARPATEEVNTSELRTGDVVLTHGMRVRLDDVRAFVPAGAEALTWMCSGTVLNLDDVLAGKAVPPSFLTRYNYDEDLPGWVLTREDAWTVQGDTLARWTVEQPRPDLEVATR